MLSHMSWFSLSLHVPGLNALYLAILLCFKAPDHWLALTLPSELNNLTRDISSRVLTCALELLHWLLFPGSEPGSESGSGGPPLSSSQPKYQGLTKNRKPEIHINTVIKVVKTQNNSHSEIPPPSLGLTYCSESRCHSDKELVAAVRSTRHRRNWKLWVWKTPH